MHWRFQLDALLNRQLAAAAGEISNMEAQRIFANCSQYETYVLLDVLKATKDSLSGRKGIISITFTIIKRKTKGNFLTLGFFQKKSIFF